MYTFILLTQTSSRGWLSRGKFILGLAIINIKNIKILRFENKIFILIII
jgi:hypothetical protein